MTIVKCGNCNGSGTIKNGKYHEDCMQCCGYGFDEIEDDSPKSENPKKCYVITYGEDYTNGEIHCARFHLSDAIEEAQKLADTKNKEHIAYCIRNGIAKDAIEYLYKKVDDMNWHTGVDFIQITETEIK